MSCNKQEKIDTRARFDVEVEPDIPEQVGLRFSTTGFQGGNHSHGGCALLEIEWEGGCHIVEVEAPELHDPGRVRFSSLGDFEISGLVKALVELGDKLRPLLNAQREEELNKLRDFQNTQWLEQLNRTERKEENEFERRINKIRHVRAVKS